MIPIPKISLYQSKFYYEYMRNLGWETQYIYDKYGFFSKKLGYLPIKFLKFQRIPLYNPVLDKIIDISKNVKPIYTWIEFNHWSSNKDNDSFNEIELLMKLLRYKKTKFPMLPTKTSLIDLGVPKNEILTRMKQKTRYNLRLGQRKVSISITTGDKVIRQPGVLNLYNKMIDLNSIRLRLLPGEADLFNKQIMAFGKDSIVVSAHDRDSSEIVAVALFLISDKAIYYRSNASTIEGRKMFAPTAIIWSAIEFAQKRKLKIFDFDGINDERFPLKRWAGFTRFKLGFGGESYYFPPCYQKFGW